MSAPMLTLMSDPQRSTLIKQGAEAKVYISSLFPAPILTTSPSNSAATSSASKPASTLLKYRFPKTYRHQTLSTQLTSSRTTAEARALVRCAKAGVNTPGIVCVDDVQGVLGLEVIQGKSIRELLGGGSEGDEIDETPLHDEQEIEESELTEEAAIILMRLIGEQIAKMHIAHVIHGDLTTSNMMARRKQDGEMEIVMIDFGLSNNSTWPEDKAVDLYVLERAFQSTHPSSEHLFSEILQSYKTTLEMANGKDSVAGKTKGKARHDKGTTPGPTVWIEVARKLEDGKHIVLETCHLTSDEKLMRFTPSFRFDSPTSRA